MGEASDSSAVRKKRTCHMADVHKWQIQTAVTCRSFCPLYMCSSSSRRWRRGKVNTGGFDPGRPGDGGQTSLKRIHPHEKVDFLNVYYVVMPSFTLFTSLNAVNFLK